MNPEDDRTQMPPPCPEDQDPGTGGDDTSGSLQMPPELMLDLARQAAEVLERAARGDPRRYPARVHPQDSYRPAFPA